MGVSNTMKGGIAADPDQLSRSKPVFMARLITSILGWITELREAAKYLLSLRHAASTENRIESLIAEERAPQAGTESADAKPTAKKPFTSAPTADVTVGPIAANDISQTGPGQHEIERRRDLVRMLFNEFWSGAHDKPTAFAKRLDQAEDYLNERLAANGEFWRLDNNTRAMLGLPPRSK